MEEPSASAAAVMLLVKRTRRTAALGPPGPSLQHRLGQWEPPLDNWEGSCAVIGQLNQAAQEEVIAKDEKR